jgi:superfamily II DNA or RNA helicase
MLVSPTASGKSLIIYMLTMHYLTTLDVGKALIIVPTTSLVSQMTSDFGDYGLSSDHIHPIFSGKPKNTDKKIVISTWQSLYKMDEEYFSQFDLVIGDEAHLFKAKSLTAIMTKLKDCRYRFGFTGTLDGNLTNKLVLEGLFGPIKKVITTAELMKQDIISRLDIKCIVLGYPEEICKSSRGCTYQQEIDYIVTNRARNKFIVNLALSLKGNTLVLFQFVEKHGKILYDMANVEGRRVFYVSGSVEAEAREEIRKIMETEDNAVIFASSGVFSTGTNIRNLHNVVFASPSKSRIRNLQSIGRVLRKATGKSKATLYDIADDLSYKKNKNFSLLHFIERVRIYAEEKFNYKIFNVELKT